MDHERSDAAQLQPAAEDLPVRVGRVHRLPQPDHLHRHRLLLTGPGVQDGQLVAGGDLQQPGRVDRQDRRHRSVPGRRFGPAPSDQFRVVSQIG